MPDCSGAPWVFPWNIFGDRFTATEPYDVAGTVSIDRCVEPSIVTTNPYNFTSFDHPDSVTGGTTGTQVFGMDDSGLIVGIYETAGAVIHGYLCDGTNFTPIDYPGAVSTYAVSINNSNKVVGYYKDGADVARGIIYKDGIFTSFEKPGATSTTPLDINDNDYMSGSYI
ncbi:MAG: hypothetical protein GY808_04170 [Gammaproteobacteria bacterium]|nr:hypothetical protein [Gammaproteobacteria bacterium]